ncbi:MULTISPECIES: hypothetical protein [unclassified Bradyrhizobium]|uniref:hypothetical protein n=1 Tax=unclassified Bradyrhizobium TaxID=2631580 RepID=UPI0028E38132|nr:MULTISPECIES: hypothetical protein [unclassified Bradyrhizobium]
MPGPLKNPRHEKFVQLFARGKLRGLSQADIYRLAGFHCPNDHSASTLAARLMQRPDIKARLAEVSQYAIRKSELSVDDLLSKTERVYCEATDAKEYGSANVALTLQSKLSGHLVEQVKIDVAFPQLNTVGDVLDAFVADADIGQGDPGKAAAYLRDLADQIEARAASRAKVINGAAAVNGADTLLTQLDEAEKAE